MSETALRFMPLVVLAAGLTATGALWQGRSLPPPRTQPEATAQVEVAVASAQTRVATLRSQGRVEPRGQIELVAEVAGRVVEVSTVLEPGRFFRAGELLVAVDPRDSRVALQGAEGALARAESVSRLADARLRRLEALSKRQVVSSADLEEAQHERDIARASVREADAARQRAERDLERCRIHAPFAGRVRARQAEVGQVVSRGTPLAQIHGVAAAEIRLPVLASELAFLERPGGADGGPSMRVVLRGESRGRAATWSGRIVGSEGEISPGTRTVHLLARIDDPFALGMSDSPPTDPALPSPSLYIGQWLTAEIRGSVLAEIHALPRAALRGPSEVWVLDEGSRLRSRAIRIVRSEGDEIWVGEGLSEGDRVVVAAGSLVPGERVRVRERPAPAAMARAAGASR